MLSSNLCKNIIDFLVTLTKAVIIRNSYQVREKADFFQQEPAYAAFRNSYTDPIFGERNRYCHKRCTIRGRWLSFASYRPRQKPEVSKALCRWIVFSPVVLPLLTETTSRYKVGKCSVSQLFSIISFDGHHLVWDPITTYSRDSPMCDWKR